MCTHGLVKGKPGLPRNDQHRDNQYYCKGKLNHNYAPVENKAIVKILAGDLFFELVFQYGMNAGQKGQKAE